MKFFIGKWLAALTIVYLSWAGLMAVNQEKLIFFPSSGVMEIPHPSGVEINEVSFRTPDGETLHGYFSPAKDSDETIVFFHGNAGNVSGRVGRVSMLNKLKKNILIFDYRGFGLSTGEIQLEEDLYIDGTAAINFLTEEKKLPVKKMVFWGRSLGGGVAVEMAKRFNNSKLILESTFSKLNELALEKFPVAKLLPKFLIKYKFENETKIKKISEPVLIMHSKTDEVIPFSHSEKLFEAANDPKKFVEISGSHNGSVSTSGAKIFKTVEDFLAE